MSVYGLSLIYSSLMGAPYVPTKKKLALEILKEVKFKKNGLFVELGSGDGRIIRTAVTNFNVRGIGIDINLLLVVWANLLNYLVPPRAGDKLIFKNENILDTDLTKADYIYLFLFPALIDKLIPKFDKELKKGAIIISHGFPMNEFKNRLIKRVDRKPFPTYYYKVK